MEQELKETQSFLQKLNWKHAVAASIVVFMIYPKPFFWVMHPLIKHFKKNYKNANIQPCIERIIFSNNRKVTARELLKNNIVKADTEIKVIDKCSQEIKEGEKQDQLLDLLAQNTVQQIHLFELEVSHKNTENIAIIVKGNKNLLRRVEAKLFGFKNDELYKIRQFSSSSEIHILEKNSNLGTFEHLVKKVMVELNESL